MQKFFGYANRLLQQLSGWLISDDLGGEDAGYGGPGLVWLHVVCGCEAGWMYCLNSLKHLWRRLMVKKWTFNSWATFPCGSVVEHCVSCAKGCGFDSQGTHVLMKMYNLNAIVSRFG